MLKIQDGVISLNRGDDVRIGVQLTDEAGNAYTMENGDELVFSVKKLAGSAYPVLLTVRSVTDEICLTHSDTCDMEVGKYSAAIRLNRRGGEVIIVYPSLSSHGRERAWNNFILDPEVVE
jgi:hypothetical protein